MICAYAWYNASMQVDVASLKMAYEASRDRIASILDPPSELEWEYEDAWRGGHRAGRDMGRGLREALLTLLTDESRAKRLMETAKRRRKRPYLEGPG
jgi:hypothetical protein